MDTIERDEPGMNQELRMLSLSSNLSSRGAPTSPANTPCIERPSPAKQLKSINGRALEISLGESSPPYDPSLEIDNASVIKAVSIDDHADQCHHPATASRWILNPIKTFFAGLVRRGQEAKFREGGTCYGERIKPELLFSHR